MIEQTDYGTAPESGNRQPYIAAHISRMKLMIDEIGKQSQEIEDRLHPILREQPPSPKRNEQENCGVPLADELATMVNHLERIKFSFDELIRRLEI